MMFETPHHLMPWEVFDWSEEQKQSIYAQWGYYYSRINKLKKALECLNEAIAINKDDQTRLNVRSNLMRKLVNLNDAIVSAKTAIEKNPKDVKANLEYCIALYESNSFEETKAELHDRIKAFPNVSGDVLRAQLDLIDSCIEDNMGDNLIWFFMRNEKILHKVDELIKQKKTIDNRPLWKIRKEQNKCDVQSLNEKEPEQLSHLEKARRSQVKDIFIQRYLNKSWEDVRFLKTLPERKGVLLAQTKGSTPILKELIRETNNDVEQFIKMLHARNLNYNVQQNKCPNRKICEELRETGLNVIQYQTRRQMFHILKTVKQLRKERRIEYLHHFIDTILKEWIATKTDRIMPWKFEFVNEMYNTLALAHADTYQVPTDLIDTPLNQQLRKLLRLPVKEAIPPTTFVFGDPTSSQQPTNPRMLAHKERFARLENHLKFAKYSIERCYILFEIARINLLQYRPNDCIKAANRAIKETKNCNSLLYKFLSTGLICKAYALQHRLERVNTVLQGLYSQAVTLRDPNLCAFVERCLCVSQEELHEKKYARKNAFNFSRRSFRSSQSFGSSNKSTVNS